MHIITLQRVMRHLIFSKSRSAGVGRLWNAAIPTTYYYRHVIMIFWSFNFYFTIIVWEKSKSNSHTITHKRVPSGRKRTIVAIIIGGWRRKINGEKLQTIQIIIYGLITITPRKVFCVHNCISVVVLGKVKHYLFILRHV